MKATSLIALCAAAGLNAAAATATFTVDLSKPGAEINPAMYGIFFEDINFAADGGLYAELVKNRSFEFPQASMGWDFLGDVEVRADKPAFDRNPHYVRITNTGQRLGAAIQNEGYRGMGLRGGEPYRFSTWARTPQAARIKVELVGKRADVLASAELDVDGKEWHKVTATLTPSATDADASLRVRVLTRGASVDLDHVSLFPVNTFKGRENGLRADLAQALYDLNPGVFRFPGGCIIEGNELATRYQWKNSVGPVENRPLNQNRWNYTFPHKAAPDYFQSYGLGFYEYFLLSEDIGAEPLPVISCGLACQYEGDEVVPMDQLQPYIDDALDLIEFANGAATSRWGSVRASMGHPEPFGLKMIAVGNEQWGPVYPPRFEAFAKAIRARYPEMLVVGSSGPKPGGDEFDYLWPEMRRLKADLVDEHYYCSPEWFLSNSGRYDDYPRTGPKVFAGEYAAHDPRPAAGPTGANTWRSALSEAAFMTGLERNADVVRLATYAPLFAHADAWQWRPDMIWFDNLDHVLTPNYYVQQLYALNPGARVLPVSPAAPVDSVYASATLAGSSEMILKLVNPTGAAKTVEIRLAPGSSRLQGTGICTYLQCPDPDAANTFGGTPAVSPRLTPVAGSGQTLTLTLPPYFFGVYRLPVS